MRVGPGVAWSGGSGTIPICLIAPTDIRITPHHTASYHAEPSRHSVCHAHFCVCFHFLCAGGLTRSLKAVLLALLLPLPATPAAGTEAGEVPVASVVTTPHWLRSSLSPRTFGSCNASSTTTTTTTTTSSSSSSSLPRPHPWRRRRRRLWL